jgi:hypothetical protein
MTERTAPSPGATRRSASRIGRRGRTGIPDGPGRPAGARGWCRYCGAWQTGYSVPVLEPAGNTHAWHLCAYCWALLGAGLQACPPDGLVHHSPRPVGSRLSSVDIYRYIREGFLRDLPPNG